MEDPELDEMDDFERSPINVHNVGLDRNGGVSVVHDMNVWFIMWQL